jgi:hypothetical protein
MNTYFTFTLILHIRESRYRDQVAFLGPHWKVTACDSRESLTLEASVLLVLVCNPFFRSDWLNGLNIRFILYARIIGRGVFIVVQMMPVVSGTLSQVRPCPKASLAPMTAGSQSRRQSLAGPPGLPHSELTH